MKIKFAVGLSLAGITAPAFAQSIPDDVRCLALSNGFSQSATEGPARDSAGKVMLFYLGRLDARGDPQAVRSAMQSTKIDQKTASAEMTACARRVETAAQAIQSTAKAIQSPDKAAPPGR